MLCKTCGKRVYEMEKIIADKAIYHKSCFKCCHCKSVLSMRNFASLDGEMFCKPHFIELFKSKGNYEEGFGKERKVKQWAAQNEAAAVRG
ncbi:hypothetical protein CAPTEDRAFT_114151 [Capitella teleta]|uniref:LIM zinc-binding domain-containing protein n=1 Tax=Capitella teleta TaxID=283909 RepID=R7VFT4_CAPTE|nr:hypothetical protein CAPTEDRAFT_114151 [Capitella teleta]|eukprot:ELU14545.1 hypothetical protein CAPTEDRAFT_114151 [Capitella teleta]